MDKYYLILVCALLCACAPTKKVVPAVDRVDSIVIVKEKVVYVHDTIPYEIPSQSASNVTPVGYSFLENDFAWSTADVDSCGVLTHVLETKDRKIYIPIVRDSVVRDSIVYREKVMNVPYPVERKLTWWERLRLDIFPVLIIVIIVENTWLWLRRRRR